MIGFVSGFFAGFKTEFVLLGFVLIPMVFFFFGVMGSLIFLIAFMVGALVGNRMK